MKGFVFAFIFLFIFVLSSWDWIPINSFFLPLQISEDKIQEKRDINTNYLIPVTLCVAGVGVAVGLAIMFAF